MVIIGALLFFGGTLFTVGNYLSGKPKLFMGIMIAGAVMLLTGILRYFRKD